MTEPYGFFWQAFDGLTVPEGYTLDSGPLDFGIYRFCSRCGTSWNYNATVDRREDRDAAWASMTAHWAAHPCQRWKKPARWLRGKLR